VGKEAKLVRIAYNLLRAFYSLLRAFYHRIEYPSLILLHFFIPVTILYIAWQIHQHPYVPTFVETAGLIHEVGDPRPSAIGALFIAWILVIHGIRAVKRARAELVKT